MMGCNRVVVQFEGGIRIRHGVSDAIKNDSYQGIASAMPTRPQGRAALEDGADHGSVAEADFKPH